MCSNPGSLHCECRVPANCPAKEVPRLPVLKHKVEDSLIGSAEVVNPLRQLCVYPWHIPVSVLIELLDVE